MTGDTSTLAAWVSELGYQAIPAPVRERVKDILLDTLASALAGRGGDELQQVERVAREFGGAGSDATVIGGPPSTPIGAALLNGYLITAATVCDVHRPTLCHVTPEVVPPALIVAERRQSSGEQFITALAAGLEVTTRVGLALDYPAFRSKGWHSPGVTGPFGGAASAGRLLGLDCARQRNAFGLAGSQSAGTFAHWGTPTIKFHQARGAMSGLLAASLAETGFEAAEDILGAPDGGLFTAYAEGGDSSALARLGEDWELMNISLRLWPVASSIQAMVTALFAVLTDHDLAADDVSSVRIRLSKTAYAMHGELGWDSRFRALLSARYVASVIVRDRACWLPQFDESHLADPLVTTFARDRVSVEADPRLSANAATVELTTTEGITLRAERDVPRGDAADPLSRAEIVEKFRLANGSQLASAVTERVVALIPNLETLDDMRPLVQMLRVGS